MRDAYLQHRNFLIERNKVDNPNEGAAIDKKEARAEVETKPFVNI
jgi:hypothetical protein